MRRSHGQSAVPVTVLTGFLGAGKTTVLNRVLAGRHGLRIGVLVNDFGEINIDADLVDRVQDGTISLANGCVCCEIRDDLVVALEALMARGDELDQVILEASGVADPGGIVTTFLDARYDELLRLDSVACVVDAEGLLAEGDDDGLRALKLRQIAFADLVVLNKTDLAGPNRLQEVRRWIGRHINRVRMIDSVRGDVPLEVLLGSGRFDAAGAGSQDRAHAHGPDDAHPVFDRWSYRTHTPFSREALRTMVKRELPATVYRCKGVVFVDDAPGRAHELQVVGRRTQLLELDGVENGTRSDVVAIGRGFDADALTALFASCQPGP